MRKIKISIALCIVIFMFSGCNSSKVLLEDKIKSDNVDTIQIVLSMGNPEYGADSKIITDKDEIKKIVDAFNSATIGNEVKDGDIYVATPSSYSFYNDNSLVYQFSFNGNNTERIWLNSKCYYIQYSDNTPFELYQESNATEIVVDESLNVMERPQE